MIQALAAAAIGFAVLAAAFVPLERAFPARPEQPVLRPGLGVDACFFLGQYFLFAALAGAAVDAADRLLAPALLDGARARLAAHPVAQAALAVALGDLAAYWLHRAFHRVDLLWRFHAVHHGAEHLDWMAAFREHPVDGALTQLVLNLPAIVLGVPGERLAAVIAFRGAWAILVHANVRLPLGPLRWLVGAPELHHWHHARRRAEHNFANLAPWLDLLFGTYHRPPDGARFALGLVEPWPRGYLAQLARPFLR